MQGELPAGEADWDVDLQGQPPEGRTIWMAQQEGTGAGAGGQIPHEGHEAKRADILRKRFSRDDLHDVQKGDLPAIVSLDIAADEEGMQYGGGIGGRHGHGAYRCGGPRSCLALLLGLLVLLGGAAESQARPLKLTARGKWRRFDIRAAGNKQDFYFEATAGCRYRVTVEPLGLRMPEVELFIGRSSTPLDTARAPAPEQAASMTWDPELDGLAFLRVGGFSAGIGKGRIRVETLDWENAVAKPHTRALGPRRGDEPARVGDLLLGEANTWQLHVQRGKAYEIQTRRGTAGGVRLRVLTGKPGRVLAHSDPWRAAGEHYPIVRFQVPAGEGSPNMRLEVEGVWSSAGTYGLVLRTLAAGAALEPEPGIVAPTVEHRRLADETYGFELQEGDMAVLWIPSGNRMPQRPVQRKLRGSWVDAQTHGEVARGQRPTIGNFMSFRPHEGGTYRFLGWTGVDEAAEGATLRLYTREQLGPAPVHMGTGGDPTARARTSSKWEAVGLGICIPGITYLFVLQPERTAGVRMRVTTLEGQVLATRPSSGAALPFSPGFGPSLRFRVAKPSVVRLEARGGKRVVAALLRELKKQ